MSAQLAIAVAVEKFADCGPGKWWYVHHPDGFLIECALKERAEQIAAEINAGRSPSPDLSLVQASAAEDRPPASAATHQPETATKQRENVPSQYEVRPGCTRLGIEQQYDTLGVTAGETAHEFRPQTSSATSSAGDPSPTSGERDLVEAGTGQKSAVLPQEPCKATITPSAATVPPRAPKAGEVPPSGLASTNLAGRDSGNPDSAILTAPADQSPAIAARQAGPNQPKIQKDKEDRAAKSIRPNCLRPDLCAGVGHKHCHACTKAMAQIEAA